jgi:hypothetical protein
MGHRDGVIGGLLSFASTRVFRNNIILGLWPSNVTFEHTYHRRVLVISSLIIIRSILTMAASLVNAARFASTSAAGAISAGKHKVVVVGGGEC